MTKKPEEHASLKNNTLNVQSLKTSTTEEQNDVINTTSTSTAAPGPTQATSNSTQEDKTKMKAKLEHMITNNKVVVFSKTSSQESS